MGIIVLFWLGIRRSRNRGRAEPTVSVRTGPKSTRASLAARVAVLIALATALTGCPSVVVRDAAVYRAELDQYDQWATRQASLLREFVSSECTCEGERFVALRCADAADWLLTVEARHGWHREMALFNAGLLEEAPDPTPPAIPRSTCPLPRAAGDEEEAR